MDQTQDYITLFGCPNKAFKKQGCDREPGILIF